MKPSDMTNEELATWLDGAVASCPFRESNDYLREAAARLRRPTPVDDDLLKMARDIDAKNAEIAELRALLLELASAANTAFDDIAKCGSIIADGDVRDAAYRTHLMERISKYRKALEGAKDEGETDSRT